MILHDQLDAFNMRIQKLTMLYAATCAAMKGFGLSSRGLTTPPGAAAAAALAASERSSTAFTADPEDTICGGGVAIAIVSADGTALMCRKAL